MDSIGWFGLGMLAAGLGASTAWGLVSDRKRAAAARAWASSAGLRELPFGQSGVPGDTKVRRLRSLPSFEGVLEGRKVSVIATSTRARFGYLWVLCTQSRHPAVFVGHVVGFASANVFGRATPSGWVRTKAGGELDAHFLVSVPPGVTPQVSDDARAALLEASVHAWCFNANPSGFTVLWFKQSYGQDTQEALAQATRLLGRLLA